MMNPTLTRLAALLLVPLAALHATAAPKQSADRASEKVAPEGSAVDLNGFIPPPQYTFSDKLEEQKKELAGNPLVVHYKACREELKKRPVLSDLSFSLASGKNRGSERVVFLERTLASFLSAPVRTAG